MGGVGTRVAAAATAVVVVVACGGSGDDGDERRPAATAKAATVIVETTPLPDAQERAFLALAGGKPLSSDAGGAHPDGHAPAGPSKPAPAEASDALAAARRAARRLMRHRDLSKVGYHLGSYWSAGVGTHFIDWRLVGRPFDPARPAMLLVDTTPGHRPRLAGLSYWVGAGDEPPDGFPGAADEWHRHRGLCFVGAVLTRQDVPDPAACPEGVWADGRGLWMLHAWVVPGYENPDGVFAPTNPRLCPPRHGIDAAWCA